MLTALGVHVVFVYRVQVVSIKRRWIFLLLPAEKAICLCISKFSSVRVCWPLKIDYCKSCKKAVLNDNVSSAVICIVTITQIEAHVYQRVPLINTLPFIQTMQIYWYLYCLAIPKKLIFFLPTFCRYSWPEKSQNVQNILKPKCKYFNFIIYFLKMNF